METNNLTQVSEVSLTYKSKIKASERIKITRAADSYKVFKSIAEFNANIEYKEMFYVMYLTKANKILSVAKLSEGGTSGTVVDIKILMQGAILQNSSAIIVSHNHLSGNVNPSNEDISVTKKIKEACKFFDIQLLDHIIITDESYYSFADEGII